MDQENLEKVKMIIKIAIPKEIILEDQVVLTNHATKGKFQIIISIRDTVKRSRTRSQDKKKSYRDDKKSNS